MAGSGDGDADEQARIEQERARLSRMFGMDSSTESIDEGGNPSSSTPKEPEENAPEILANDADTTANPLEAIDGLFTQDTSDEADSGPGAPAGSSGDTMPSGDTDAVARLNRILAEGGRSEYVVKDAATDSIAFANDVGIDEARRRVEREGKSTGDGASISQVRDTME